MLSENKCELTCRIARLIPSQFWIPWRRARCMENSYSLPSLVEDLQKWFSTCSPPLVAGEEVEPFDWEDEVPSPSALESLPISDTVEVPTTSATVTLTPAVPADDGGTRSVLKERTNGSSGHRSGRTSAAVVSNGHFLCFGAGLLTPFRVLSRRLLIPRSFAFSPPELVQKVKERRPGQTASRM
ncbi:hypothetical protein EI94DRAFT_1712807 [Lactarius quietus]|nr:hypothetical protein EI94DRAFT_1712807 [Lactarius quietus]